VRLGEFLGDIVFAHTAYWMTAYDFAGVAMTEAEAQGLCDDAGLPWGLLGESQVEP
jgi:hypothetical protein